MKKLVIAAVLLAAFVLSAPLFAQQISPEHSSAYFYENVTLEKVYPTRWGYVLVYQKGIRQMTQLYIPNEWFTDAGSKAELITLPKGGNWPSISVYFKDGQFSHLRLYVHPEKSHPTWGSVPLNVDLSDKFKDLESIKLEY